MQPLRRMARTARAIPAKTVSTARTILVYWIITALSVSLVTTVSVFMYGTFYFAFVPAPSHEGEIFPIFEPCAETMGKCGFLNGTAQFTKLELPETLTNVQHGMFMNCIQLKKSDAKIIRSSCRATMMQYRSELLKVIETLLFTPFLLSGYRTEKQWIHMDFFEDFLDDPLNPATVIDFQVNSRFIEVYQVRYQIHAKFVGLRYYMYRFPLISAVAGSMMNFMFLSIIILLSWYRFFAPDATSSIHNEDYTLEDNIDDLDESVETQTDHNEEHEVQKQEDPNPDNTTASRHIEPDQEFLEEDELLVLEDLDLESTSAKGSCEKSQ